MLFRKKKIAHKLRLEKYWDDSEAVEAYRLVEYEFINGKLQDGFYWRASGDKKWAEKTARHYKLSIMDAPKDR